MNKHPWLNKTVLNGAAQNNQIYIHKLPYVNELYQDDLLTDLVVYFNFFGTVKGTKLIRNGPLNRSKSTLCITHIPGRNKRS